MSKALMDCGTPFGTIKNRDYLLYVLDIRDHEMNSTCFVNWGKLRDIEDIRREYETNNKHKSLYINF